MGKVTIDSKQLAGLYAHAARNGTLEQWGSIALEFVGQMEAEVQRCHELLNTPETADFLQGVKLEAAHQIERWGAPHDRSKSAENWFWLVGYLAGKALRAAVTGDRDKALHHCISTAAACANWHAAIVRDTSGAGIGEDADIRP